MKTKYFIAILLGAVAGLSLLMVFPSQTADPPQPLSSYVDSTAEKGRYLAAAGNCVSCHTASNGKPFAGGLPFLTPFGTLYSSNISSDTGTGIGSWTFEQFYNSIKLGEKPDGTHLYPAFPFTAFSRMNAGEIASLYLYMQSIDPVTAENKANDLQFPYNLRSLMYFWKKLYHRPDAFVPVPEQSDEWNRGAYLVEGPGHCGACHSPRNYLGAENEKWALTGGLYHDRVATGRFREWSTVNLTPASTGLGSWSKQDIVEFLQTGSNSRAVVHGPMNHVVMNSTRHLSNRDLNAIGEYLASLPPRSRNSTTAPGANQLRDGEVGYTVHCGSCHLPTGLGDPILGVPLAGSAIVQAPEPAALLNIILYGAHLPAPPFVVERTRMKMFGKRLSDKNIAAIATYIRASFGNEAGAVSPEQVKRQR